MYWIRTDGAADSFAPQPLSLRYGQRAGTHHPRGTDLQRAYTATGRRVRPSDCGPIRVLAGFGHTLRAPGRVVLQRAEPDERWREFSDESSAYGAVRVSGDRWEHTESGFVGSWIAGSEYAKIATGIAVYFPQGSLLYQGPVPNRQLVQDDSVATAQLEVMAGMEYFTPTRSIEIAGESHGIADMNVIVRVPPAGETVTVERGQVIGWFYLVSPVKQQRLGEYTAAAPARSEEFA